MSMSLRLNDVRRTYETRGARKGRMWWSRVGGKLLHVGWDDNERNGSGQSVTLELTPEQASDLLVWLSTQMTDAEMKSAGYKKVGAAWLKK